MQTIAKAFVAAQKAFGPALKTATNPHFRSKYADLSACVEAVIDSLNANGIALIQNTHESDSGVTVETIFLHESGETISSGKLHVPAAKNDPQGYGSALTYARRYSLMAACGIAPEDDDGNAASRAKPNSPVASVKSIARSVWDDINTDQQNFLTGIAIEVIAALAEGNSAEAHRLFYNNNLDTDEKTALWSRFDSKQRSAITAYKNSLEKVGG